MTPSQLASPGQIRRDFDRIALFSPEFHDRRKAESRWVLRQLPKQMKSILEVGCGTGNLARLLASRADEVTAIDLSPKMIELARRRSSGASKVRFEVADIMKQPFPPNTFDAIVSIATLHHLQLQPALRRMSSWLKPGGRLLIVDLFQSQGFRDFVLDGVAFCIRLAGKFSPYRVRPGRDARRVWSEHAKHDHFLTLAEIRDTCHRVLPGAKVRRQLMFRYSIVWSKE